MLFLRGLDHAFSQPIDLHRDAKLGKLSQFVVTIKEKGSGSV